MSLSGRGAQTKSPDGVQAKWTGIEKCLWPCVIGTKVIRPSLHTPITPPNSSDFWIRSSRSRDSRASLAEFWSTSDTTGSAGFPVVDCGTAGWCCRFSNWWHLLWRNFIIGFNIWNSKKTELLFSWYFNNKQNDNTAAWKHTVKCNVIMLFTELSNLQIQTLQYMNLEFRSLFWNSIKVNVCQFQ